MILKRIFIHFFPKLYQKIFIRCRRNSIRKNGINVIEKVTKAINSQGSNVFVDYGTLLGIVRDGKIISWDDDIDFGIHISESFTWNHLEKIMNKLGYRKNHYFTYNDQITEQNYSKKNIFIDFFNHYENENNSISYVYDRIAEKDYPSDNSWNVMEFKTPSIVAVQFLKVNEQMIPVPSNFEEYLSSVYGAKWRTPNPNWKTGDGPATTKLTNTFGVINKTIEK